MFTVALWVAMVVVLAAAELKPATIAAFDRYVELTETRMKGERDGDSPFLWVDRLPNEERDAVAAKLSAGETVIEQLKTLDAEGEIKVPKGTVHHWVATLLLPGVTIDEVQTLLQDYDRYAALYAPDVREAKLLSRDGARFRVYLQLFKKKVITVVLNTEYDVLFERLDGGRMYVTSYSTRIQEVEHPDSPEEREKPEGHDRGFMWRFYNYCSFEQRTGDTYMQCESLTLSRTIPFFLRAIMRPFVTGIPRDGLTFNLEATRRHLID